MVDSEITVEFLYEKKKMAKKQDLEQIYLQAPEKQGQLWYNIGK